MVLQVASERLSVIPTLVKLPGDKRVACVFPAASRGMGIFFCATRGSGKSRGLGRGFAFSDLRAGVPLVILDPVGGTIDNLLDKIRRQPIEVQREIWPRVKVISMDGLAGRAVPWPIYYEAKPEERLSNQSARLVEVIARVDPRCGVPLSKGSTPWPRLHKQLASCSQGSGWV